MQCIIRAQKSGGTMSDQIKTSRDGTVATITIDRPAEGERTHPRMLRALTARLKEAGASDAKVIALRSTGADFCKGRDGKGGPQNPDRARHARPDPATDPRRL